MNEQLVVQLSRDNAGPSGQSTLNPISFTTASTGEPMHAQHLLPIEWWGGPAFYESQVGHFGPRPSESGAKRHRCSGQALCSIVTYCALSKCDRSKK